MQPKLSPVFPTPRPGIAGIEAYVGGRANLSGVDKPIKLSSNESALGPSPAALAAYGEAAAKLALYPDGGAHVLRDAIAQTHGLDAARIVCGNGSDELIALLCAAYLRPGDEVVISRHAFIVYEIYARANDAQPVFASEKNFTADVDAMLACVTARTRIVFLANPNNPTGTYLPHAEVRRLHEALPPHVLLVLDAAYAEFVRRNDYESGIEMVSRFDNVAMTRTFSKIHALAALRIGWAYLPPAIAATLNKIRGPFNVSLPSQMAGAAAMTDRAHVTASVAHNDHWQPWLAAEIRALGIDVTESVGNFLLLRFADEETAHAADRHLCAHGLILRGLDNYHLPDCLRLTVGNEDANRKLVAALAAFMGR